MDPTASEEERRLAALVRSHDRWRGREVFNLLPSENAVSPTARRYLSSDLAGRYTLPLTTAFDGETIDNSYTGTRYTDQIETLANAAAARVFRARFATTRPLSGHIAALSALVPLLPPRSKILAIAPNEGGYDGYAPGFVPALFGYTVRPLPADGPGHSVRASVAVETIRQERPRRGRTGAELFPVPLSVAGDRGGRPRGERPRPLRRLARPRPDRGRSVPGPAARRRRRPLREHPQVVPRAAGRPPRHRPGGPVPADRPRARLEGLRQRPLEPDRRPRPDPPRARAVRPGVRDDRRGRRSGGRARSQRPRAPAGRRGGRFHALPPAPPRPRGAPRLRECRARAHSRDGSSASGS